MGVCHLEKNYPVIFGENIKNIIKFSDLEITPPVYGFVKYFKQYQYV